MCASGRRRAPLASATATPCRAHRSEAARSRARQPGYSHEHPDRAARGPAKGAQAEGLSAATPCRSHRSEATRSRPGQPHERLDRAAHGPARGAQAEGSLAERARCLALRHLRRQRVCQTAAPAAEPCRPTPPLGAAAPPAPPMARWGPAPCSCLAAAEAPPDVRSWQSGAGRPKNSEPPAHRRCPRCPKIGASAEQPVWESVAATAPAPRRDALQCSRGARSASAPTTR